MVKSKYNHIRIAGITGAVSSFWQSIEECAVDPKAPKDFNLTRSSL